MANIEAKALRTRRQEQTQRQQARRLEENTPVTVGVDEPSRKRLMFGDPTEPRVAEVGGMGHDGIGTGYRVAECDVTETIYPAGCVTPVVRVRWRKGHRVPAATYERWLTERQEKLHDKGDAAPASNVGAPAE